MLVFLNINVHLIKNEQYSHNPLSKLPENINLLFHLYPSPSNNNADESIYNNTIKPLLKEFT